MWSNIISKTSGDQCDEHWFSYQQKAEVNMRRLENMRRKDEQLTRWVR